MDNIDELAGVYEGLLGFVMRNESDVVIEGHVPLPAETVEDGQQAGVLGINSRPNKFDDGNVMAGSASWPDTVAKHKSQ
jgi:hypothetical protein